MFQLSSMILLAVLMFVNLAFMVSTEDLASEKSVISANAENITLTNKIETDKVDNQNESSSTNADKNVTSIHQKTPLNVEASTKTSSTTSQNLNLTSMFEKKENHTNQKATNRPVEETTPRNNNNNHVTELKIASDLTAEQKDLNNVSVSPRDEEESVMTTIVPITDKTNSSVSIVTEATTSSSTTLKTITETITVGNVPILKEKHNENSDSELQNNVKHTTYQMNTTESINVTITEDNETTKTVESSNTTSKSIEITTIVSSKNDQVEVGISSVPVENEKKVKEVELNINSKPLSTNEKDSSESMPPGIIVLITALAFAVAIVVGYISIIIWKQYLQHRYGRRELLVNELEFDTNDLRHFEL